MNISACGLICDNCPFFKKQCKGCYQVKGKPFWTEGNTENNICPLFDCAINVKGHKSCGDCEKLPCSLYYSLKDPNISEEEHLQAIKERVSLLKPA